MDIVATDLDRTLFPNGKQPYDSTMPLFKDMVIKSKMTLIYVTGRNLQQIQAGIREYNPPRPLYAVAEVGTRIYRCDNGVVTEEQGYVDFVRAHTPNWNISAFRRALADVPHLRLQEAFNQNDFKLSYYVDRLEKAERIVEAVERRISDHCPHTNIIYSVDETIGQGLLDILPKLANKMEGLEYVRKELKAAQDDVIYCGDSGNDLIPLTFGYRGILVKNAIDAVRTELRRIAEARGYTDRIYFAKGTDQLNGNYVSGILEGLAHFGVIDLSELPVT